MKIFYVEGYLGWFVIFARTHAAARKSGVDEYGRGLVKSVRLATLKDIDKYRNLKGDIDIAA